MGIAQQHTFWLGRPVLVTGGAGFIGSWLSHGLLKLGARVVILDIKKQLPYLGGSMDKVLRKAVFVRGDVRGSKVLERVFARHRVETVFHLAAKTLVQEAEEHPALALETNVGGTWQVLETVRKIKAWKVQVIVSSSDKAYGEHATLPYEEDFPLLGENPYDCSKSCADRIAHMYATAYGLPLCITRCANVFGGGDLHFSRLIPGTIRSLLLDKPVEIRSDGLSQRDYVYVKDVVEAHLNVAYALAEQKISGEAFNFGSAKPLKTLDVVNRIAKAMQKDHVKPVILATARHEIKNQYLDASKARRVLAWEPRHSFEQGIRETILWYQQYFQSHGKKS